MKLGRLIVTRQRVGQTLTFKARVAYLMYFPFDILVVLVSRAWREDLDGVDWLTDREKRARVGRFQNLRIALLLSALALVSMGLGYTLCLALQGGL